MAESVEEHEAKWFKRFLILFFIGLFIILLGVVSLVVAALFSGTGTLSVGGVVFIWFFPIVFGAGPEAHWLILFAIVLAVLGLIMLFVMWRAGRTSSN